MSIFLDLEGCYTLIMTWRKGIIWGLLGFLLVFIDSIFIQRWLGLAWAAVLGWRERDPWRLILIIGLASDLFLLEPLGKGVLIYLGIVLAIKWLRKIFAIG